MFEKILADGCARRPVLDLRIPYLHELENSLSHGYVLGDLIAIALSGCPSKHSPSALSEVCTLIPIKEESVCDAVKNRKEHRIFQRLETITNMVGNV